MGWIFNNGNGGAKCDCCSIILFVGNTHRREQRPYVEKDGEFLCNPGCVELKDRHVAMKCDGMGLCPICEDEPFDYARFIRDMDAVSDHDNDRCSTGCVLCAHQRGEKKCLNGICCTVVD